MFAAALSLSASAFAQNWILPAKTPDTPVYCGSATICKAGPAWLAPYEQPVASFVGRFLDSSGVGDSNRWPIATVRAMSVKSLPGSDRIYLHMNASVAMYRKASFIQRLSSDETLGTATSFPGAAGTRGPDGVERLLWPDAAFAAPFARTIWTIPTYDFTPQLGTFDVDDQGYVYLAYWQYGLGIIKDQNVGFSPVSQTFSRIGATFVVTMKTSGGRYYALLADGWSGTALYDVTDRSEPVVQPLSGLGVIIEGAKNLAQDRVALVDSNGAVKIFTADTLAAGSATPVSTFTPTDGGKFRFVVSDGTNFYGVSRNPSAGTSITVFTPSGATYAASQRYELSLRSRGAAVVFEPNSASYSDGYLTIGGGFGTRELRIFRVSADTAPAEIDTHDYFRNAYSDPPPPSVGRTFVTAATAVGGGSNQLTSGSMIRVEGREYLVVNAKGLGDVYEMNTSSGITTTALTSSANPSPAGESVTFTATVTSADNGAITGDVTFRDGANVLGTVAVSGGSAVLSTSSLTAGTHAITASYAGGAGSSASTSTALSQVINVSLSAPAGLTAIAVSPSLISLSWSPVSGATSYEIYRTSHASSSYAKLASTTAATFSDTVSANATYLYRVRAIGSIASPFSAVDVATTVMFSDGNLTSTPIKAAHIMELRTAVNAMRAAAGLDPATYTDVSLAGARVKAVHITELRNAVDAARAAIGLTAVNYTDPALIAGVSMKSAHVTELRGATQ